MNVQVSSTNHLPQLDSIRGLACLMVLIVHLKDVQGLGWLPDIVSTAGVGLFFALSGFLITRILLADRTQGRGLNGFYNRRAARIFPIYFLTLAVLAVFWPGKELWWAATFTFNFQYVTGVTEYFHTDVGLMPIPPIAHFWSLCVEEHFYWVWPAIVAFTPSRFYRWFPVVVIAASPLIAWEVIRILRSVYFQGPEIEGLVSRLTVTQLVALSLGALTAIHEKRLMRSERVFGILVPLPIVLGAAFLSVSLLGWRMVDALSEEWRLAWQPTLLHMACGGLFLLGLGTRRLGQLRWLAWIGTISYGLYLYHLPIYAALGLATADHAVPWWKGAAALALTFVAALASYQILEAPLLAWVRRRQNGLSLSVSRPRVSVGSVLTLIVFVAAAGLLAHGYRKLANPPKLDVPGGYGLIEPYRSSIGTIVVGNSQANNAVATPYLPGMAINLASPSQDLYYSYAVTEKCLDSLPKLKRVIVSVAFFTFRFALSEVPGESWRAARFYHGWGIEARNKTADPESYSLLAAARHEDGNPRRTQGWDSRENVPPLKSETAESIVRELEKLLHPELVAENKQYLINLIKLCQSRNIEVIVVSFPTHSSFRQYLDPAIVAETAAVMREVCAETGVRFLDYSADPRFVATDFMDPHHMNHQGAIKLTAILSREIFP